MHDKTNNYRTNLKRVRGLGAAHEGTGHFWLQRTSALALIPLSVWFMIKLVTFLAGTERGVVAQWFSDPISAVLMAIFMSAMFVHAKLGMQVIIEDYVQAEGKKLSLLMLTSAAIWLLGIASVVAITKLHFFGI